MNSVAIVPAAGHSQRMGRHKLLMPWDGRTVIEALLSRWQASHVSRIVVVARRNDRELIRRCRAAAVELVLPAEDPPDMKASVRAALEYVEQTYAVQADDVWLLAPADMPRLSPHVVDLLLQRYVPQQPVILVPVINGRRGHPVLLPWTLAAQVSRLAADEGVNALLGRHPVEEVPCEDPAVLEDLDTPADYGRLRPK